MKISSFSNSLGVSSLTASVDSLAASSLRCFWKEAGSFSPALSIIARIQGCTWMETLWWPNVSTAPKSSGKSENDKKMNKRNHLCHFQTCIQSSKYVQFIKSYRKPPLGVDLQCYWHQRQNTYPRKAFDHVYRQFSIYANNLRNKMESKSET